MVVAGRRRIARCGVAVRRTCDLHDDRRPASTSDNDAIGEHIEIVVLPLAGRGISEDMAQASHRLGWIERLPAGVRYPHTGNLHCPVALIGKSN